ncbi:MAG: preprotein translocase subunit SecG [Alphaproteobacteria bacterium]|nr:MAG: preprotein translocase subunit SecG [Alphaproteobacteria bacterium]
MLVFVWAIYLAVVISICILVLLQKGEDVVGSSQASKFMAPRAMSNFLSKTTYVLYFLFVALSILIGILLVKKKEHMIQKVDSQQEIVQQDINNELVEEDGLSDADQSESAEEIQNSGKDAPQQDQEDSDGSDAEFIDQSTDEMNSDQNDSNAVTYSDLSSGEEAVA